MTSMSPRRLRVSATHATIPGTNDRPLWVSICLALSTASFAVAVAALFGSRGQTTRLVDPFR